MNELVKMLLEPNEIQRIKEKHFIEVKHYGVYEPPKLKQLISLRHLMMRTGYTEYIRPEFLTGLSKAECNELLKKLNKIFISERKNSIMKEAVKL